MHPAHAPARTAHLLMTVSRSEAQFEFVCQTTRLTDKGVTETLTPGLICTAF